MVLCLQPLGQNPCKENARDIPSVKYISLVLWHHRARWGQRSNF